MTKRGFATKEEADEYDRCKRAKNFHHETNGKEKNTKDELGGNGRVSDKRKNNSSNSSSTNDRKNEPIDDPSSDFKSNKQILSKDKQKAGSNEEKMMVLDLVLPRELQEKEGELKELKKEFANLQKQQSSLQDKINQQSTNQPPQKEFNWLYVVIPMGAVIVGLLFLLLRKERKAG